MKSFSLIAALMIALAAVNSFAATTTIQMGNAVNRLNQKNYGQYQLKIEYAKASAFTSDSNSKLFGAWKKCFTRTENVPYDPLAPYIYSSIEESTNVTDWLQPVDGNKIALDEAAIISLLKNLEKQLNIKTNDRCDIESSVGVHLTAYIPELDIELRSFIYLTKKHGKALVHFTQWAPDMSGAKEGQEFLPNQTPIELGFPY